MNWRFHHAHPAFPRYREMWDELNRANGNHPLLDSGFVELLVRHFAGPETLLGVSTEAARPGLALVTRMHRSLWSTFQPSQAPLGLIVLGAPGEASRQVGGLMRGLPGYALSLSVLQQDPAFTPLTDPQGVPYERLDYIQTARLTLSGSFEEYWKGRSRNLTHNLSRQRRRLADQGIHLELVADRDPARVADGIREYGRLESQGWKAGEGTAVATDNLQGVFYRELLERFCAQDEGVIYRLLMDGKTVAADLCLERNGMAVVLKTAYDETVSGLSLGLLLHHEILKAAFAERRVKVIEFYGRVRDWHTKFTDEIRTMYHITFYRHAWVQRSRRLARSWLDRVRSR